MLPINSNLSKSIRVAQFSDCHLFQNKQGLHYGANVYENLHRVLCALSKLTHLDFVVFTGDLTQDHSEESYQNFAQLVREFNFNVPVYFVPGNHDERSDLTRFLSGKPFSSNKTATCGNWHFSFVDSKSETPAGYIASQELANAQKASDSEQYIFLFMHHHPIDVGYFIDRHGLENKEVFWKSMEQLVNLRGLACGHVHNDMQLTKMINDNEISLFTCPATSIQFAQHSHKVEASSTAPAFRLFEFNPDGSVLTNVQFL